MTERGRETGRWEYRQTGRGESTTGRGGEKLGEGDTNRQIDSGERRGGGSGGGARGGGVRKGRER